MAVSAYPVYDCLPDEYDEEIDAEGVAHDATDACGILNRARGRAGLSDLYPIVRAVVFDTEREAFFIGEEG